MSKYWFKPKSHGYGASPATWEGWLVTAIAGLAPGLLGWLLLARPADAANTAGGAVPLIVWGLATCAIFVGYLRLARRKTDGEWRWRWKGSASNDPGNAR